MPRRPTIRVGAAGKPERKGSEVHFRKPFRNSFPSNKPFPNSGNAFPETGENPRVDPGSPDYLGLSLNWPCCNLDSTAGRGKIEPHATGKLGIGGRCGLRAAAPGRQLHHFSSRQCRRTPISARGSIKARRSAFRGSPYELYAAYPQPSSWQAGSGVIFNLKSNALRPAGWTSADAAGACPFNPGWRGTTKSRRARSGTLCDSRFRTLRRHISGRRGIMRRT